MKNFVTMLFVFGIITSAHAEVIQPSELVALGKRDPAALAEKLGLGRQEGCKGLEAFFMGRDPKDQRMHWSIRCGDDRALMVTLKPNGTVLIADCKVMETVFKLAGEKKGPCFTFLEGAQ